MTSQRTKEQEIDRNLEFFKKELPKLLQTHKGKYALLRDQKIVEIFDTATDAQRAGTKMFPDGIFSVQQVTDQAINLGFFSHAMHMGQA